MAPQLDLEFVILRITFVPYEHPDNPQIYMHCRQHPPSASKPHVREWFSRILSIEKSKIDPNQSVNYCEWNISSSDANLFIVNDQRFDSILLILAEDTAHWVFFQNTSLYRRLEGSGSLPLNYCSCCLGNQYMDVVEAVKGSVIRERISDNC